MLPAIQPQKQSILLADMLQQLEKSHWNTIGFMTEAT